MHGLYFLSFVFVSMASVTCRLTTESALMIPFPSANYWHRTAYLAQELKLFGYNTTVVLPDSQLADRILSEFDVDVIISDGMTKSMDTFDKAAKHASLNGFSGSKMAAYDDRKMKEICPNIASDEKLLEQLRRRKFKFAILGISCSNLCVSVVPYKLSIPFIRLEDMVFDMGISNVLQIHPGVFPADLLLPYNDKMVYFERFINVLYYFLFIIKPDVYDSNPSNVVEKFAPEKENLSNDDLQAKTELYLLENDALLDYHLSTYPNVIPVGGIATRPAAELTGKLKQFMDSAKDGVVIVSFGSVVTSIPDNVKNKFIRAFQQLPKIKFVFKCDECKKETHIDNVLFMRWIPQNDLLGHPNAKLLISQCGMNAQYEALYHAVPVICIPAFGDQYYNSIRMKSKGYGSTLNVATFTENELIAEINDVFLSPVYRQNIFNASTIFRNRLLTPSKRAAWWIDHVIKYGGRHLQPPVAQLPLYQLLLADVLAGLILIFAAVCFTFLYIIRAVVPQVRKSKPKRD